MFNSQCLNKQQQQQQQHKTHRLTFNFEILQLQKHCNYINKL